MRADYSDAAVRDRVYALLDTSFLGLSDRIQIAGAAGAHWHQCSVPFVAWESDVAVAHAGVLAIPMVAGGVRRMVAGVHAVCTRPERRGRGYARQVLAEALAYVDDHFDAAILTTAIPSLYERFGFTVVAEHTFVARTNIRPSAAGRLRRLGLRNPEDVALLHRLLKERAPVSRVLAAVDDGWLFLTNEVLATRGFGRLHYVPSLNAVIVSERTRGAVRLLDVVSSAIPSLGDLLGAVGAGDDGVELCFTPDEVGGGPFTARPQDRNDLLMIRGDLEVPQQALVLSPLARC